MKKLNELLNCKYDTPIKGIKTDSREIEAGDLFVAVKGYNVDHSKYITAATTKGAAAIVTDKEIKSTIPLVVVDNIDETLVNICKKFYDYDNDLELIGITGTDGKTTTATMIKNLLDSMKKTAYIGTNGMQIGDEYIKTDNTTPAVEKLYSYLSKIKTKKCKMVSLEVSSEALLHKRVNSLKFKYAIYTNITEDHLNVHKTIDNYIKVKNRLVNLLDDNGTVIVNNDDENCRKLSICKELNLITYGKNEDSDFIISNIKENKDKTTFNLVYKKNVYSIESPYFGEYNVYNLTAAIIVCMLEKMNRNDIINNIKSLKSIPGRCEKLDFGQKYTIILDYAHTENGIRTLVENIKKHYNNITVVTGSAGGRETEKRSRIGKYLLNNTNQVIFTMDDPRYENVDDIINQMIGNEKKTNYKRINERTEAIKYALTNAKDDEIVLIIGKGRDNYMALKDKKVPYCDYDVIESFFNK